MNDAFFTFLLMGRAKTDGSLSCLNSRNRSSVTAKNRLMLQCQCNCQELPVVHHPVSFEEPGLYLYGTQKDGKQQRVGFLYRCHL